MSVTGSKRLTQRAKKATWPGERNLHPAAGQHQQLNRLSAVRAQHPITDCEWQRCGTVLAQIDMINRTVTLTRYGRVASQAKASHLMSSDKALVMRLQTWQDFCGIRQAWGLACHVCVHFSHFLTTDATPGCGNQT
jgi:hypothetical protein